jgi:hypothetical protein
MLHHNSLSISGKITVGGFVPATIARQAQILHVGSHQATEDVLLRESLTQCSKRSESLLARDRTN